MQTIFCLRRKLIIFDTEFRDTIIKRLARRLEHDTGSRDRDIIACDASGGTRAPRDDGADDRLQVSRAHDAMHADPESPASREEAHLLPDEWLKIKPVPGNGNLSPGVYYPTVSKRFVDALQPVPSPTANTPYCCFSFFFFFKI